jgi:hypothetical protein
MLLLMQHVELIAGNLCAGIALISEDMLVSSSDPLA